MQKAKMGFSALMTVTLMAPSTVWAQATPVGSVLNTANTTSMPATTGGLNSQNTTANQAAAAAAAQAAAANAANIDAQELKAMQAQQQGAMMAMVGAAFSAGMAGATCPQQPPNPTCPLWILGAVTSGILGASMANAANTSLQGLTDATNGLGTGTGAGTDISATQAATNAQISSAATAAGITPPTPDGTVTFPDGRTVNANDAGSDSKLAAAGLSPSEIASFHDIMAQASKAAEKSALNSPSKSMDGDNSIGGGPATIDSTSGKRTAAAASRINRDPAQIAGLSKNYNGDPIGVASENLFTLINRRYDLKAQQNNLLTPGSGATAPTKRQ